MIRCRPFGLLQDWHAAQAALDPCLPLGGPGLADRGALYYKVNRDFCMMMLTPSCLLQLHITQAYREYHAQAVSRATTRHHRDGKGSSEQRDSGAPYCVIARENFIYPTCHKRQFQDSADRH